MNIEPFRDTLTDYILSGHAYLQVRTTEKIRFLTELKDITVGLPGDARQVFPWSQTRDWRDASALPVDEPAVATEGYTGADVKEVVTLGLKLAFHAGRELANDHLLQAIPEMRPLSQTDPERVTAMTEWLDRHAKPASTRQEVARCGLNSMSRKRHVAV